ncbi:MAG: hypothetical protein MRY75_09750 [Marivita sp.]|uniref:hypothetical protein n=1 Tax=Marivita sp. TaxID=2003365 RepID=UPI0025C6DD72|nr:hypothetical protein [Marivita sp.]MCI5110826.1 hypothetical protein [Marivita sp.]
MSPVLRTLWTEHRLLLSGFVLASAVMLFFGIRTVMFWVYWADPAHQEEPIAGWMTPGYVAQSWDVPIPVIRDALGVPPETRRETIRALADARGVPQEEIVRAIEDAIAAHRANAPASRP